MLIVQCSSGQHIVCLCKMESIIKHLLVLLSISIVNCEEYYVVTEGGEIDCPNDSPAVLCQPLYDYVNQSDIYFTSKLIHFILIV